MKNKITVRITATVLSCLLLCGIAFGGGWIIANNVRIERGGLALASSTVQTGATAAPVSGSPLVNDPADAPDTEMLTVTTGGEQMSASEIYEKNINSIVGITTEGSAQNVFGQNSSFAASGSGFVISSDGYIVTNNHVVEDGTSFTVAFADGTVYSAKLIGTEPSNDVALLKIEAEGLTPVTVGSSADLKVGEDVIAIGNPLGELTFTLTKGVVSALDRVINTGDTPMSMFQIDAAVNSGNSGGPVFNSRGQVVGIVTAKYSDEGVEGLGFAIPINDVASIVNELRTYGFVDNKPYFGITVTTAYTQSYYGDDVSPVAGAKILSVDAESCSARAGLQVDDIITSFNGRIITSHLDLVAVKGLYKAGDTVSLEVYRGGETLTIEITLDKAVENTEENSADINEIPGNGGNGNPFGDMFPGNGGK